MNRSTSRGVCGLLLAFVAVLVAGSQANAQVTGITQARGQIYFSSDNDAFNYAAPVVVVNPGTGNPVVNALNALTGIPGAPAGGFASAFNIANSFSFLPPGGYAYTQADPLPGNQKTVAGMNVKASVNLPLINKVTAPKIVAAPFTGLHQGNHAPGFAFEQFDFDIFYSVGLAGLLPAIKTPTVTISGNLVNSPLGSPPFAEVGEELNYYQVIGATSTLLGSAGLYQSWNTAGPIFATVTGPSSPINQLFVSTAGLVTDLEVTGTVFLEGDPSSLDVSLDPVPAPRPAAGALVLFGMVAAMPLLRRAGRFV
jgi:hypothetical protein